MTESSRFNWLGFSLGISAVCFVTVTAYSVIKLAPVKGKSSPTPVEPVHYPNVDQVRMELMLRSDEKFWSVQHHGPGFMILTTQAAGPNGVRVFRVYSGIMGNRGVMIDQPRLWYTVKEQ